MLGGLSDEWTVSRGDQDNWQVFDVVGHLIHGEETDWIPRVEIILAQGENRTFVPFDRFAQFERSKGKTLDQLLEIFKELRAESLDKLATRRLTETQLDLKGMHPELGEVTLRELLASWVVHDLNHIKQIVAIMAGKYSDEVGPWTPYMSILQ
jgi:uncharacterized damage-inducible protein DinB